MTALDGAQSGVMKPQNANIQLGSDRIQMNRQSVEKVALT